jgi:hypothetical protein
MLSAYSKADFKADFKVEYQALVLVNPTAEFDSKILRHAQLNRFKKPKT